MLMSTFRFLKHKYEIYHSDRQVFTIPWPHFLEWIASNFILEFEDCEKEGKGWEHKQLLFNSQNKCVHCADDSPGTVWWAYNSVILRKWKCIPFPWFKSCSFYLQASMNKTISDQHQKLFGLIISNDKWDLTALHRISGKTIICKRSGGGCADSFLQN